MTIEYGRSVSGEPSGLRPFGAEPATQSQAEPLVPNAWPLCGYAPGSYMGRCHDCGKEWIDQDKRSWRCLECAVKDIKGGYERLQGQYAELIFAVARKYPGETRHETALRYIREREDGAGPASAMSAGTAKTAQPVEGEARQRDGNEDCRDAQTPSGEE